MDHRHPLRLVAVLAAALLLVLAVGACGEETGGAPQPPAAGHNEADVAFLHLTIPHHEGGIEMAMLAERRGSPPVKALAQRIVSAQEKENEEMRKLLEEFAATGEGPTVPAVKKAAEAREMKALEEAPPEEFDHLFLEHMMSHHMGAVELAEFELMAGSDPRVKHLAQSMKDLQVKEAEEMQRLLTEQG